MRLLHLWSIGCCLTLSIQTVSLTTESLPCKSTPMPCHSKKNHHFVILHFRTSLLLLYCTSRPLSHCKLRWYNENSILLNTIVYSASQQFIQEIWESVCPDILRERESLQQFRFSSSAENLGVHTKLMYKYQILYLNRIMIVPWRHLVNDIDLCRRPKSPKNP